jgi:hypothetical protein
MAAGTIPLSMSQQFDIYGQPLAGGQLYIITAGTVSTPQDAFADTALSIKQPYPMTLDAAGRIPQFFLDNTVNSTVKVRLQDKHGVVQLAADSVLIIGPSGGGGGGGTIDPTTIYQTGDLKARYSVGAHSGWVRANNLTIGSASSGATERANLDCQALFQFLWGADSTLAVSGGRGANAAADWTANKTIATPDYRGYGLGGLVDMGNTASTILTTTYFGTDPTKMGAAGGSEHQALASANLPPHAHAGDTDLMNTSLHANPHKHTVPGPSTKNATASAVSVPGGNLWFGVGSDVDSGVQDVDHRHHFATDNGPGTSTSFSTASPMKLCTIYLKL